VGDSALFAAVFLACVVESVEATTIVLAAGTTRQWRSTLIGVGCALAVLAIIVVVLGPAIALLPLGVLRVLVGFLLVVFGLQWLRKAILRASGYKSLHDEAAIFRTTVDAARSATLTRRGAVSDWYAFTLAFKGVLLEGDSRSCSSCSPSEPIARTSRWPRSPPSSPWSWSPLLGSPCAHRWHAFRRTG
jgi:uncharacterized membrane protein